MSKRHRDTEYIPEEVNPAKPFKYNKNQSQCFLTKHQNQVWDLHSQGNKPGVIAKVLCLSHGLVDGAINAKQVSNWIGYHKKAGNHPTRPISLKNNNLRPDRSDNWYEDAIRIADEDGVQLVENETSELDSDGLCCERTRFETAAKLARFFSHTENDTFALFVECGLTKTITAKTTSDHKSIELSITIPVPADDLFHAVGFQNATQISVNEVNETFFVQAPRRLSRHHHCKLFQYPNEETPVWFIYLHKLEKTEEEKPLKMQVNLLDKLVNHK